MRPCLHPEPSTTPLHASRSARQPGSRTRTVVASRRLLACIAPVTPLAAGVDAADLSIESGLFVLVRDPRLPGENGVTTIGAMAADDFNCSIVGELTVGDGLSVLTSEGKNHGSVSIASARRRFLTPASNVSPVQRTSPGHGHHGES